MSQENSSDSAPKPYPEADSSSEQSGKVSETASTAYAVRTNAKWRPSTRTIAGLAADDEVWAFVKANDLLPHLETAIQLVRKTIANACEMQLSYEPDAELPKLNSVVIRAKARGTVEELFEQEQKYIREFVEAVPPAYRHQIGLFLGAV